MLHLIKQSVEKRMTSAWERSIFLAVGKINLINRRRKDGGYYFSLTELEELIDEAYPHAVQEAAYEAFEGKLSHSELAEQINSSEIKQQAITLLSNTKKDSLYAGFMVFKHFFSRVAK